MPKIKRFKTYPFPFLAEYTSDYKKTKFLLNIHYTSENNLVKFQADYTINNQELIELLEKDKIVVGLKIVCRPMGFSKTFQFPHNQTTIEQSFDSMKFEGDVSFQAYLVSRDEFSIDNSDLSNSWINEHAVVLPDNVIGESNERIVTITHIKSGSSKSIFKFTVNREKEDTAPYSVSLVDDDCIVFVLSQKTYRQFEAVRKKEREFIYTLYIIPTIGDILRRMINEKAEDEEVMPNKFNIEHSNKRWYIVLSERYSKAFDGKDPTEGLIPPQEAAQTIIDRYAVGNMLAIARRVK